MFENALALILFFMQCAVQYWTVYSFYSEKRYLRKRMVSMNNSLLEISFEYFFFWFANDFKWSLCIKTFLLPVPLPALSKKPQIIACPLCRVKFYACLPPAPEKWCWSFRNITLCSSANEEAINHQSVFQLPLAHSPILGWYLAILISLLKDNSSVKYYRHFAAADN